MKKGYKNIVIGLVFLFLYIPIFVVILFSFNTSKMNIVFEGFTLQWYESFFRNRSLMDALTNSLIIAVASTVVSVIVGTVGAVGMERYEYKGKKLVNMLLYVPIVIPEIVLGVAMLALFSLMKMEMGLFTMTLAHITFCIPFVVLSVRASLSGLDKSLEEASMDLGANHFKTFMRITLPLIAPGVISGATLSMSLSIDDVIISFFVCGPGSQTLPLKILEMVKHGVSPDVNALSAVITLLIIVAISTSTYKDIRKIRMEY